MTADNYIMAHLAALAHREANFHGGIDNMMAVAFVIRNRVQAGWNGGNWMANILAADQHVARISEPTEPDLRDINFRMLLQNIDDIYHGMAFDRWTEGALYYAELNRIELPSFKSAVLDRLSEHPRVATVGNVVFFK